jgi:hypothetical protein
METAQVLNVVERLFNAAEHPDIALVKRYGRDVKPGGQSPAGVSLRYQSDSEVYIWAATGDGKPVPADLPAVMPSLRVRAPYALRMLVQLLDTAKPDLFTAWRTVSFPGLGLPQACGLELKGSDGTSFYLRVTAGSGPTDPAADPFPDYVIPEGVATCLHSANAASAEPR